MSIEYTNTKVILTENVSVDDAEVLLGWIQDHRHAEIDLRACTHMHAANLQVLMATGARIVAWPDETTLRTWIETAITIKTGERQ